MWKVISIWCIWDRARRSVTFSEFSVKISSKSHKSAWYLVRNAQRFQKFGWFLVDKFFELVRILWSIARSDRRPSGFYGMHWKLKWFLESLDIFKQSSDTLKRLERTFQWKFCKNFWLLRRAWLRCVFDTANGCIRKNLHSYNMTLTFPVLDILCFQNFD